MSRQERKRGELFGFKVGKVGALPRLAPAPSSFLRALPVTLKENRTSAELFPPGE
ncbi:hypothetical protein [Deinococcus reticulitermitis]|nr:hypothetical protein [Deinococcus reticulitermitis]